jgi:hypothetical protein
VAIDFDSVWDDLLPHLEAFAGQYEMQAVQEDDGTA